MRGDVDMPAGWDTYVMDNSGQKSLKTGLLGVEGGLGRQLHEILRK